MQVPWSLNLGLPQLNDTQFFIFSVFVYKTRTGVTNHGDSKLKNKHYLIFKIIGSPHSSIPPINYFHSIHAIWLFFLSILAEIPLKNHYFSTAFYPPTAPTFNLSLPTKSQPEAVLHFVLIPSIAILLISENHHSAPPTTYWTWFWSVTTPFFILIRTWSGPSLIPSGSFTSQWSILPLCQWFSSLPINAHSYLHPYLPLLHLRVSQRDLAHSKPNTQLVALTSILFLSSRILVY